MFWMKGKSHINLLSAATKNTQTWDSCNSEGWSLVRSLPSPAPMAEA